MHIFPFSFAAIFLSQIIPGTHLHHSKLNPACTCFLTPLVQFVPLTSLLPLLHASSLLKVLPSHSHTHVFLSCFKDFHYSCLQNILPPALYSHCSPQSWRLPSDLICQPVHQCCKQERAQISDVIPPPP